MATAKETDPPANKKAQWSLPLIFAGNELGKPPEKGDRSRRMRYVTDKNGQLWELCVTSVFDGEQWKIIGSSTMPGSSIFDNMETRSPNEPTETKE